MLIEKPDIQRIKEIYHDVHRFSKHRMVAYRLDEKGKPALDANGVATLIDPFDFIGGTIDLKRIAVVSEAGFLTYRLLQECARLNGGPDAFAVAFNVLRSSRTQDILHYMDPPKTMDIPGEFATDMFVTYLIPDPFAVKAHAHDYPDRALKGWLKERPGKDASLKQFVTLVAPYSYDLAPKPKQEKPKRTLKDISHEGEVVPRAKRAYTRKALERVEPEEARRQYGIVFQRLLANLDIVPGQITVKNNELGVLPETIFDHLGIYQILYNHRDETTLAIHEKLMELVKAVAKDQGVTGLDLNTAGSKNWGILKDYAQMIDAPGRVYAKERQPLR